MSLPNVMHECSRSRSGVSRAGAVRQTVELMVLLCLCVLLVRTFSAEAYVVPTGSMAPTLLGLHRELTCANCRFLFVVGIDEEGQTGQAVCPNCGQRAWTTRSRSSAAATAFWCRSSCTISGVPERWEVAVFHFPGEPSQAYVKRVVGLPGESIRIDGGDIFVDGQIVRKSLPEIRAMRILVHDSRFQPRRCREISALAVPIGIAATGALESGWKHEERRVRPLGGRRAGAVGRRLAGLQALGPVAESIRAGPRFLRLQRRRSSRRQRGARPGDRGTAAVSDSVDSISVALRSGSDQFLVRIPVTRRGAIELVRNERAVKVANNCHNPFEESGLWPRSVTLEALVFDRRVQVAIDGQLLFDPYDYDDPARGRPGRPRARSRSACGAARSS